MTKTTKRLLLAFAGIVVLIAASFTLSSAMRENFREIVYLLSHPYNATPAKPSPNPRDEVGSIPPASDGLQVDNESTTTAPQKVEVSQATSSTSQKSHNVYPGPALYRNDEFGFEFTIPEGWQVKENPYSGPYSYFNLILVPLERKASYLDAFLINIVKPEFIEKSYRTLKPSDDPIMVDGVNGVSYEYAFGGGDTIDYILPRPQETFIIGSQKEYSDIFNEVVASLKFIDNRLPLATKGIQISVSPGYLTVTDPDGYTITKDSVIPSNEEYLREIPGELYYSEMEKGESNYPITRVYSPKLKEGNYIINVFPREGMSPNDTYSLEVKTAAGTVNLAQRVPIGQAPDGGYKINISGDGKITLTSS